MLQSQAMQNVNFTEVKLTDLSDITHQILLSEHDRFDTPEFKIIRYIGIYKYGSEGKGDFTYIRAVCQSACEAWWSKATILDFSQLDYQWGDEMDSAIGMAEPLVILVGEKCRKALKTLWPDEYDDFCCDTMEQAITLARTKIIRHDEQLEQQHQERNKQWSEEDKE